MQDNLTLQEYIDIFSKLTNAHICIWEFSNLLFHPTLHIEFNSGIHSKPFCDIAKSTVKGYKTCIRCKQFANMKAIKTRKPFSGHCVYGLYEVCVPIVENGKTIAAVYVGNLLCDRNTAEARIKKVTDKTKASEALLLNELNNTAPAADLKLYFDIAKAVADYILNLKSSLPEQPHDTDHWLICEIKQYLKKNYTKPLQLKDIARLYGFNEKYAGRLFKATTGISFSQYLNYLRLKAAKNELLDTENSVLEISLNSGFENVTYFNRIFKKNFGVTPTEFRQRPKHS